MAYKEIDESNITLIDSVSSFIEMIRQVKETKEAQDGTSTELYFRGQETEFWDIEPSIFRDDMLSIEHKLMQIPLQKSPTEFRDLNSMFDIMTKYQHYGMCTRLLDLTTNPLVALYFACKKHGAVKYVTEDGEVEKEPYGVIYYTDKYYSSQSTDIEIQIVSALASYDLEKENTLFDVLERLYHDRIIDEGTKNNWLYEDVLIDSLYRLNRDLPDDAIQDALFKLKNFENGELVQKNAAFMDYLQNGVPVRYFVDGEERSSIVYLVDYKNPDNNSFIIANQWTFIENSNKRPDVILFLNGLPVVLVELKSPSREETDASEAYRQLRNYMQEIPSMFIYNAICVMSDQLTSKAGTITSGEDRFMEWKTKDGDYENTQFAQRKKYPRYSRPVKFFQ